MHKRADRVQVIETRDLGFSLGFLRQFLDDAFDYDFSDSDFANALAGVHFIVQKNEELVAHASVLKRAVLLDGVKMEVSYVEAVAVAKQHRGFGYGQMVMNAVSQYCLEKTNISLLSSEDQNFYARFGWLPLAAKSYVMTANGMVATASEDDGLMFLASPSHTAVFETIVALDRPTCPW